MLRRTLGIMLAATFLATLNLSSTAFAVGEPNAFTKLGRGAINLTTGWLELPVQTVKGAKGDSPVVGVFCGFGKGILRGLQRTGMGLADGLSFPIGPYDNPVMEPETVFGPTR